MKKVMLVLFLAIGTSQMSNAQIDFGIKAGVNYNSDSFQDVKEDVLSGAESKTGFHAGIWSRIKLPIVGLYVRPELVYTQLSSDVDYKANSSSNKESGTYDFKKIDLPVLVGYKILSVATVYVGPSFQYILDSDFSFSDLEEVNSDGFSLGIQFGAGVEFGKLGIDLRWERALSDTETEFVNNNSDSDVNFDTRVNQIIVGLSYKF